jgi:hypothetical protein
MVSVLPVVPVRKYCAVYYLAHDSYQGMEEVALYDFYQTSNCSSPIHHQVSDPGVIPRYRLAFRIL